MEYPLWLYVLIGIMFLISSFGATFLVSFFGGHRDIKSISIVSVLLLLLHGGLSIFDFGGTISLGVGGFISIIIFVKFLDFEPMGALFAGFLFSIIFTVIALLLTTSISSSLGSGYSSKSSMDLTDPSSWTDEQREAIKKNIKIIPNSR